MGSGPSLWLAERHPQLRGLVLQSGLLSGLRVLAPAPACSMVGFCGPPCVFALCDVYPNHRRLRRVKCPVLIMHGRRDEVIDVVHSEELLRLCPPELRQEPYFVPMAGHNDLVEQDAEEFFRVAAQFVRSLEAAERV